MHQAEKVNRIVFWVITLAIVLAPAAGLSAAQHVAPATNVAIPGSMNQKISNIHIKIEAPPDRQLFYETLARRLIALRPGDAITQNAIDKSLDAIRLSHRFSAIHVDSETTSQGERLVYTLTPYKYIKDIQIQGNYPLFESDILNQMTLYPGDPYTEKDLSEQTKAIIKRYKREGYIAPYVSIQTQPQEKDESTVLVVDIKKGAHYRLGTLAFEGRQGISSTMLKLHMRVWRTSLLPGGRFSEYRLDKDADNLLKYYREKGFFDAELTYQKSLASDGRHVDVVIKVKEGPRYTVSFLGNERFWGLTLKKDLVLYSNGNRRQLGIRKSVKNIKQRYREAGFLETRVKVEKKQVPDAPLETYELQFVIQEGPETTVETVDITGNHRIKEEEIKKQLLTRPPNLLYNGAYVPETLEEDVYAVTTLYMQQGFQERDVNSKVDLSQDKTQANVTLTIEEGPQTLVGSIVITGLTTDSTAKIKPALAHQIGQPFRQSTLDADKETIASLVSEEGYPHVAVEASATFNTSRTQADIEYRVDPGPLVKLGDIFISGNLRTAEHVIRRELEVQPGAPLSLRSLHDGQRNLRDLAIFHDVSYRTIGLKEKAETVYQFVDIEEAKPYYTQLGLGYESDSGFYGRAKIGDHNLFGLNKDLWAGGEISETGFRLETRLTEPRFLGTHVTASIGAFHEELTEFNQPFGTRTTGGTLSFGKDWGDHWTTALSFRLEKRDQFSVEGQSTEETEEDTRTIVVTTPYIRYDSRDSFVRPKSGFLSSLSVDISKGIQQQLDNFVRYQLDTRYYLTPIERITFASLARFGQVVSYAGTSEVPDDQLFYLGGIQDVRGYKENLLRYDADGNPVGGKRAMVGSIEARIDLGMNFELTTFFDIGSVQNTPVEDGTNGFRSSVGMGLRYITPIGPMGLLYGHKLNREEGESAGRFHLSIGYSF